MDPILPLTLVVSLPGCATACPALLDICCQMTASILRCPFSQYSVFPRQGPYWETNVHAGRIVLHLKSVIWHRSATRFRYSQSGFKTRDYDGFGIRPLCLIFFICSNVSEIYPTSRLITRVSLLAVLLMKVFATLFGNWFSLKKIISVLRLNSAELMKSTNAVIMCMMFRACQCLDPVNKQKHFFERIQDYQAIHSSLVNPLRLSFRICNLGFES